MNTFKHDFTDINQQETLEEGVNGTLKFFRLILELKEKKNIDFFTFLGGASKSLVEEALNTIIDFLVGGTYGKKLNTILTTIIKASTKEDIVLKIGQHNDNFKTILLEAFRILSCQVQKIEKYILNEKEDDKILGQVNFINNQVSSIIS